MNTRRKLRPQTMPDSHNQVLRRGVAPFHPRHIEVEVAMIDIRNHCALHELTQLLQVEYEASLRGDVALHDDIELVIVSVPVGARTQAEDFFVLFLRPVGSPQPMRRTEMQSA